MQNPLNFGLCVQNSTSRKKWTDNLMEKEGQLNARNKAMQNTAYQKYRISRIAT